MKKHKVLGIVLVSSLPIILVLFALSNFIFQALAPQNYTPGMEFDVTSTQARSLVDASPIATAVSIIKVVLSLLGILSVICFTPLGIYFLVKKDNSMDQVPQDPTVAAKYQNLTPEQIKYIRGGSLGAFFGGIIWSLGNKLWLWALLSLIPLVNIYVWLKLTFHGRRMAWETAEWQNFDQFRQRQKVLGWIIVALALLYIIVAFSGRFTQ